MLDGCSFAVSKSIAAKFLISFRIRILLQDIVKAKRMQHPLSSGVTVHIGTGYVEAKRPVVLSGENDDVIQFSSLCGEGDYEQDCNPAISLSSYSALNIRVHEDCRCMALSLCPTSLRRRRIRR